MTMFTNRSHIKSKVAFSSPYPGKIIVLNLSEYGGQIICQKNSFLCAEKGTQIEIAFQKNVGVALFGGEGLALANLTGPGTVRLQSLPFSRVIGLIKATMTGKSDGVKDEGSLFGNIGIGNLLGGRN